MADSDKAGDLEHLSFTMSSLLAEVVIPPLPEEFNSSLPKETIMIFHQLIASQNITDPLQDQPHLLSLLLKQGSVTFYICNFFVLE